jgi:hypothetical protein
MVKRKEKEDGESVWEGECVRGCVGRKRGREEKSLAVWAGLKWPWFFFFSLLTCL